MYICSYMYVTIRIKSMCIVGSHKLYIIVTFISPSPKKILTICTVVSGQSPRKIWFE